MNPIEKEHRRKRTITKKGLSFTTATGSILSTPAAVVELLRIVHCYKPLVQSVSSLGTSNVSEESPSESIVIECDPNSIYSLITSDILRPFRS